MSMSQLMHCMWETADRGPVCISSQVLLHSLTTMLQGPTKPSLETYGGDSFGVESQDTLKIIYFEIIATGT